jgi:predicted transcriptional regulator
VWLLLDWQADREAMIQARARALLTIRLNNEIRGAVSTMASAILFREQEDRLRIVDEAMQQVDRVLVDLTPTSSGSSNGRYGR